MAGSHPQLGPVFGVEAEGGAAMSLTPCHVVALLLRVSMDVALVLEGLGFLLSLMSCFVPEPCGCHLAELRAPRTAHTMQQATVPGRWS